MPYVNAAEVKQTFLGVGLPQMVSTDSHKIAVFDLIQSTAYMTGCSESKQVCGKAKPR